MTGTLRLFVAVDPAETAAGDLARVVDRLQVSQANASGRSTRLTARTSWHITLAFLGDVPEEKVTAASAALDRAAGAVPEPITVRLSGGGRFGRGQFTILWTDIGGDRAALVELATSVRRELRRGQVPFDHKPFRPHLTLARPGDRITPGQLAADLETLASYEGPEWMVDAVHLYSSELGPQPRHTRLASARLPGR